MNSVSMRMAVVLVVSFWASAALAQLRGSIYGAGKHNYPIAISPLKNLSSSNAAREAANRFADIVGRDLTISGYFNIIDRAAFIEKPEASGIDAEEINFDNWSVL